MKVLNIHEVGDVRLDPHDPPEAGPNDVVLKMKACGICGSDLSYIKMGGIMREPGGVTPIGHEGAGEVLSVGGDVSGLKPGDPVIINPMNTPSLIGSGGPEGAFCDQVLVRDAKRDDNLLPIPEGVPYDVAAMCEPLAVALHGVNRAEAKPGDKVAVFGCGPIGLGMVLWLADRGVEDIVALDLADERLERARSLGAKHVINPGKKDMRKRMGECHGETTNLIGHPAVGTDAFIDAAGGPTVLADIINMCKGHSRIVITAAYMNPVELPLGRMLTSEPIMTTAVGYPTEMNDVVSSMARLKDKIATMISHHMPFEKVIDGIRIAGTPDSAKVMIEFEGA